MSSFEPEERGRGMSLPDFAAQIERMRLADAARSGERPKPRAVEDDDQIRERHMRRLAPRRAAWEARRPALYRSATLESLAPEQQPGTLRSWLTGEERTLFLAGPAGGGKTYAAYALGAAAVDLPMWVEAWNVVELLETLLPGQDATATLNAVLNCDLLILDDLYAPKVTDWAAQTMYRIADRRVNDQRKQVVTTNGEWEALVGKWGEPTMDRLGFRSTAVVINSKSRRQRGW